MRTLSSFLQSSLSIAYVGGVEKTHKDLYGVKYYALQIELAGFVEKEKVNKHFISIYTLHPRCRRKSRDFQCYPASK